jgi:solute carrier family 35, member F5
MFGFSMIPITVKYVLKHGGISKAARVLLREWREESAKQRFNPQEANDDETGERLLVDDEATLGAFKSEKEVSDDKLTMHETVWLSLQFCMIWFFGNYFASACLQYTSVGSTTILTSTSSVWTLILGSILAVESFSVPKLLGVISSLSGIVLISLVDLSSPDNDSSRGNFPHKSQQQIAIGDAMALFSAMVYGLYAVFLKLKVGNENRVSMLVFFGLVGVFNLLLLWPIFFFLHFTGIETVSLYTPCLGNRC